MVFLALAVAVYYVVPSKAATSNTVTLLRYDPDHNMWVTMSWPYVYRNESITLTESPHDQYPTYDWGSRGSIYAAPPYVSAHVRYQGYFGVCNEDQHTCNQIHWAMFGVSRDSTHSFDAGDLSYRHHNSVAGYELSGTYSEDEYHALGGLDYYVWPVPSLNGGWYPLILRESPDLSSYEECSGHITVDYTYYISLPSGRDPSIDIHYRIRGEHVDPRGWGYDLNTHQYIVGAYSSAGSCYPRDTRDLRSGYLIAAVKPDGFSEMYRVSTPIGTGPCHILVAPTPDGYRVITHVIPDPNKYGYAAVELGPVVSDRGFLYKFPGMDHYVCVMGHGNAYDPFTGKIIKVPPPPISLDIYNYTYPLVSYGSDKYIIASTSFSLAYDDDHDGVPDLYNYPSWSTQRRYELLPIRANGIEFNTPAVVPKTTNRATLYFRLDYNVWPGATISVSNINVSVDNTPVDANISSLSDYIPYTFTYGDHNICYSFTVRNGNDIDSYNKCYHIHIGYLPWNVSFTYDYNGPNVTLLASAQDDTGISKYHWYIVASDVNGVTPGTVIYDNTLDVPVLHYTFPAPGDYNVTLTVYDTDNNPVTVSGILTINHKLVPSGVRFVPVHETTVVPVPVPSSSPSGLSAVPLPSKALVGLSALALIAYLVIAWM